MHLVWFGWSLLFLGLWGIVYITLAPESRQEMRAMSAWTALFAFTEPLFVPAYWNPPSLFDLAQKTGFDLESFIFCFAIGGLSAGVYERVFPVVHEPLGDPKDSRERWMPWAVLLIAPLLFAALDFALALNPIYSAIAALTGAGIVIIAIRPDLFHRMAISAGIFLGFYFVFFLTLIAAAPGYVERVWNIPALTGILIGGIPLEELLFAVGFGFCWSGLYEFILRRRVQRV
jgi:hypothetical protein